MNTKVVPNGLHVCDNFAISFEARYARWIFVRHIDGGSWTTCAQMTQETWDMLLTMLASAPAPQERREGQRRRPYQPLGEPARTRPDRRAAPNAAGRVEQDPPESQTGTPNGWY